ncbi:hypothetical protein Y032_0040g277 [Ancylostoma ceylanicum]|uniref:Uncharacterized protein n=1 Tax=Ancylostoma ceylanicum TaxID=53326 RepID=A0A016UI77_9BILA|nr:hypothetical protein Y032_0040g277 [Ancylostoma ceylanicum]
MSLPSPAKRRCASVRPVTSNSQKCGPGASPVSQDIKAPVRCSTASPLIPTTNIATFDAPRTLKRQRSPEPPVKVQASTQGGLSPPNANFGSTSIAHLPKFAASTWVFRNCREQRIAELQEELRLVESGKHPKFLEKLREFQQKQADEMEMIDIMYEREKEEIERKFRLEHAAIQRELKEREDDLVQALLLEVDDRIRFIEAEVAVLDVAGPACPTFSMNKKCLRRRPHDTPTSTEKKKARTTAPAIIHLLPEHIIAEDVRLLVPAESIPSVVQHHKVSLDNGKLIYEGKTLVSANSLAHLLLYQLIFGVLNFFQAFSFPSLLLTSYIQFGRTPE